MMLSVLNLKQFDGECDVTPGTFRTPGGEYRSFSFSGVAPLSRLLSSALLKNSLPMFKDTVANIYMISEYVVLASPSVSVPV